MFHNLGPQQMIQECQHCQLPFISANKKSTSPMKYVTLKSNPYVPLDFQFSHLLTSLGANKDKNYKYMGTQS